jgi:integrase
MAKGSLPTAVAVKNAFQGIATAQKTLCVLYQEMLDEFQSRVGIDRSKATLEEYQKGYKYLCDFLKEKYHVHDMALIQLDLAFVESYDHYLRINRRLKAGTAVIMFIPLRKVVLTAVRRNLIVHYPFAGYKFEQPRLEMRSLSAEELQRLLSTPQQTPTLSLIRDIFAFAAFTGISHADLERMTWENIQVMEDGSRWLSMKRQKTGIPFLVKLLDIPLQLMERYRGMARGSLVFPYLSLSRVNVGLKQVAQQCGIDKSLSFHVARHTFGTVVCLSQGVPIESVSRMLGHRRITTTQRYARVDKKKIGDDMKRFAKCIETKFNFKIHAHGNE